MANAWLVYSGLVLFILGQLSTLLVWSCKGMYGRTEALRLHCLAEIHEFEQRGETIPDGALYDDLWWARQERLRLARRPGLSLFSAFLDFWGLYREDPDLEAGRGRPVTPPPVVPASSTSRPPDRLGVKIPNSNLDAPRYPARNRAGTHNYATSASGREV